MHTCILVHLEMLPDGPCRAGFLRSHSSNCRDEMAAGVKAALVPKEAKAGILPEVTHDTI